MLSRFLCYELLCYRRGESKNEILLSVSVPQISSYMSFKMTY